MNASTTLAFAAALWGASLGCAPNQETASAEASCDGDELERLQSSCSSYGGTFEAETDAHSLASCSDVSSQEGSTTECIIEGDGSCAVICELPNTGDLDGDGAPNTDDCDSDDDDVYPGAPDPCGDGVDSNCDGEDGTDADADGYAEIERDCGSDCDDDDANLHPSANETCDDLDNDCDGLTDDADDDVVGGATWYCDSDRDGYPDAEGETEACERPNGCDEAVSDCDGNSGAVHPGADESCSDGLDNDCDAATECALQDWDLAGASLRIRGPSSSRNFGISAAAGDLDGDGLQDVLVGAPGDGAGGGVYAFLGPTAAEGGTLSTPSVAELDATGGDFSLAGPGADADAGSALAIADFNDDGIADVAVGDVGADPIVRDEGAVYVVFGPVSASLSLADADALVVPGVHYDAAAGSAVAAGDFDGDGNSELVVGVPWSDTLAERGGSVWRSTLDNAATYDNGDGYAISMSTASASFGSAVVACDIDGDSRDELVAAYGGYGASGGVLVFQAPAGELDTDDADAHLIGLAEGDQLGSATANALSCGDADGDGNADIFAGAWQYDPAGREGAGGAFLFLASTVLSTTAARTADVGDLIITGTSEGEEFGMATAIVPRVTADREAGLLVGAPGSSDGAAYLFVGTHSGSLTTADATSRMLGEADGGDAGFDVESLGDVNGDGLGDFSVGDNGYGYSGEGAFYLLLAPGL